MPRTKLDPAPLYRSSHRLLSREEEQTLAIESRFFYQVRNLKNSGIGWTEIAQSLGKTELELMREFHASKKARDKMWTHNMRLVVSVAKKIRSPVDFKDTVGEGVIGLDAAIEKFDPSKGWKFSTYAVWWIRQAIQRKILSDRMIRLPCNKEESLQRIKRHSAILSANGTLSIETLSRSTGLTPERIAVVMEAVPVVFSSDILIGKDQDNTLLNLLPDPSNRPSTREAEWEEVIAALQPILDSADPKEAATWTARLGIGRDYPLTHNEIAKELDISVRTSNKNYQSMRRRIKNNPALCRQLRELLALD